jgi:large subunit ribosomal protein L28
MRECQITGRRPVKGFSVSHSNSHTKREFVPNLQTKRFFLEEEGKWVKLKVSARAIKTISKNGLAATLKKAGLYPTTK